MPRFFVYWVVAFLSSAPGLGAVDPVALSADYYYSKYDYKQALQLWSEVLKRQPANVQAVLRVCELKMLFEGRVSCRDLALQFLQTQGKNLDAEGRRSVRERLDVLQKTFLTDRGQSLYLQAVAKTRKKDCPGAFGLLNQASEAEKGNVRILKEKFRCEKSMSLWDRFYETTKLSYENDPFDTETIDNLGELYVYYREYEKAAALLKENPESPKTTRSRLALGIALFETGAFSDALTLFRGMVEQDRQVAIHPVVWLILGKIMAKRSESSAEASSYLQHFISATSRPNAALIDGWDPYRCQEHAEEATRLLGVLNHGSG